MASAEHISLPAAEAVSVHQAVRKKQAETKKNWGWARLSGSAGSRPIPGSRRQIGGADCRPSRREARPPCRRGNNVRVAIKSTAGRSAARPQKQDRPTSKTVHPATNVLVGTAKQLRENARAIEAAALKWPLAIL
jgi:hypothetical protein